MKTTQLAGRTASGHTVTTTVTTAPSGLQVHRQHTPDCPRCAPDPRPARIARRRKTTNTERSTMSDTAASFPTYTLQRWNWTTRQWDTHGTYGPDERGEDNAHFAVSSERASQTGPIRLLKDGNEVLADDPATYYAQAD